MRSARSDYANSPRLIGRGAGSRTHMEHLSHRQNWLDGAAVLLGIAFMASVYFSWTIAAKGEAAEAAPFYFQMD